MSRVVVTGMALVTPLGDRIETVLDALDAGVSGVAPWSAFATPPLGARVGGDLSGYDLTAALARLRAAMPHEAYKRLDRMFRRLPWCARMTLIVATDAALDARWWQAPPVPEDVAVLAAGHNFSPRYTHEQWQRFQREPDYVDPLLAVHMLDSNHPACVSELLGTRGALGTVGAACASGNLALRAALDELADGARVVVVVAPVYEYAQTTLQALGFMRATTESEDPASASRPFDVDRDGFVPSHGCAAIVLEHLDHAVARGAHIRGEILAAEAGSDACHRPPRPSPTDQADLIAAALDLARDAPPATGGGTPIDFISAHAASTQVGDVAEARALGIAFGETLAGIPVNAPKALLGHTGWSAALVQLVLGIGQLERGSVHATPPASPDPAIALSFTTHGARPRTFLNNAFGFGGLNGVAVVRRFE